MPVTYLITGLPRSGTTLLTSLLSKHMEAVTFSEPEWFKEVRKKTNNCEEFVAVLSKKIESLRDDIRNGSPVYIKTSRFHQGLPQNYYHRREKGKITVDKDESPIVLPKKYADRPFIIKANAQFTACLNELVKSSCYKVICLVRNPVSVIMSWRSLNLPISKGNMKIAEKYSFSFIKEVKAESLLQTQVLISDWFFKQYTKHKQSINLIKYEDLIDSTSNIISNIIGCEVGKIESFTSKNRNSHYDLNEVEKIKEKIVEYGPYSQIYYELSDI